MSMRGKRLTSLLLVCGLLLLLAGCGAQQEAAKRPPLVKTTVLGASDGAQADTYAGTVRGRYETHLAFQVGGQILARNVDVGSRVQAGDVLQPSPLPV